MYITITTLFFNLIYYLELVFPENVLPYLQSNFLTGFKIHFAISRRSYNSLKSYSVFFDFNTCFIGFSACFDCNWFFIQINTDNRKCTVIIYAKIIEGNYMILIIQMKSYEKNKKK